MNAYIERGPSAARPDKIEDIDLKWRMEVEREIAQIAMYGQPTRIPVPEPKCMRFEKEMANKAVIRTISRSG
jgi:hypothetical protein